MRSILWLYRAELSKVEKQIVCLGNKKNRLETAIRNVEREEANEHWSGSD